VGGANKIISFLTRRPEGFALGDANRGFERESKVVAACQVFRERVSGAMTDPNQLRRVLGQLTVCGVLMVAGSTAGPRAILQMLTSRAASTHMWLLSPKLSA
jgi:hypothetical protein